MDDNKNFTNTIWEKNGMDTLTLIKLCDNSEFLEKAAQWFSEKWKIPVEAYQESILECVEQKNGIPQWYIILDSSGNIIAGAGIIENDFHDHKDLRPNLCALFVEEEYRNQGIATYMLNFVRKELGNMGYEKLYLITDHTEFYEKCGWSFLTMVNDDQGAPVRMYVASTIQ